MAVDRTLARQVNWLCCGEVEAGWPSMRQIGDVCALVSALTNLGAAELSVDNADGHVKLQRSVALAQRYGLVEQAVRAFCNLVQWALQTRRLALASGYLDRALDYCTDPELDGWRLQLLAYHARLELDLGNWSTSTDLSATVLRNRQSPPIARARALTTLGLIRARRGDPDPSGPLDDARDILQDTGEFVRTAPVVAARAEGAWLVGDHDKVATETETVLDLARRRHTPWIVGELAYWRHQAGLHDHLDPHERATPYQLATTGQWAAAAYHWAAIGCPYETALALAHGDPQAHQDAIQKLQHLGARQTAATIIDRSRKQQTPTPRTGPRRQTLANPAGLTPRELEVLTLLPTGLHNAEIAQQLIVSKKTIDHHVQAILRKLGVHSRHQASIQATRLGIGQPQFDHRTCTT